MSRSHAHNAETAAASSSQAGPMLEQPGDWIGSYRLMERIGEGGFGVVWLAERREPMVQRVAIKVIKPGMDSREVIARFEQERQALAVMDHPNIARVLDAGATPAGRPYFVMEYVRGESITSFCDRERLPIRRRLEIFSVVCDAVQHAHHKGIIHRDIKPSNVLVGRIDSGGEAAEAVVKVIDFGVAKAMASPLTERTLFTERGELVGTPEYMSPEQAEMSASDIDTRADVYSLGVLLYELLTGVLPFDPRMLRAAGFSEIQRIIREVEPARPSDRLTALGRAAGQDVRMSIAANRSSGVRELTSALRGELEWIPMKAMRKDRTQRYRSAADLADDVRNFLDGRALMAGPESAVYRARKFVRRHRLGVASTLVVVGALGAGAAVGAVGLARAVAARDEAEAVTAFLSETIESVAPDEAGRDVTVHAMLDRAGASIGAAFEGRPLAEARLRASIGNAYRGLGLYAEAEPHVDAALRIRSGALPEDDPLRVRSMGDMAALMLERGRLDEAQRIGEQAVNTWAKSGREETRTSLGIKNNLVQVYARQGKIDFAERMQREVLDGQRRVLGKSHTNALGSMMNLASILARRGEYAEAESLLLGAVSGLTETRGERHPATLLATFNLAGLYLDINKPAESQRLYREVLAGQREVLGESHPSTARTEANLALALTKLGDDAAAEPAYLHALEIMKRVLGESHEDTLGVAMNAIEVYERLGWPERSRPMVNELFRSMRHVGDKADASAEQLNSCAWFLLSGPEDLREPQKAMEWAKRACDIERASAGKALWSYLDTLALAIHRTGRSADAASVQREAIGLLDPNDEGYRGEMEARLREYEVAAGDGR